MQHASTLRELTRHMGSHSVTCHLAELTFPPLPEPIKAPIVNWYIAMCWRPAWVCMSVGLLRFVMCMCVERGADYEFRLSAKNLIDYGQTSTQALRTPDGCRLRLCAVLHVMIALIFASLPGGVPSIYCDEYVCQSVCLLA